jgi:hydroxymethylpyrimidine pyrophosphatase-like HAD family hydrolase
MASPPIKSASVGTFDLRNVLSIFSLSFPHGCWKRGFFFGQFAMFPQNIRSQRGVASGRRGSPAMKPCKARGSTGGFPSLSCLMVSQPFKTSHAKFDVIICDIDGCLSSETSRPFDLVSLAKVAAHNRLAHEKQDRPILTLCTGRPQPFAESMTRLLHNLTLPLVAENGVWLYHPAENRYEMDPSITREHRRMIGEASAWIEETFGPSGVSQQPGKACSISLYHTKTEFLRDITPALETKFKDAQWPLRVSMTWNYINCDLAHVSKGTGIDRLLQVVNIPRKRLAGIGDTMSDLAIRERVGLFACPSNAVEQLRAQADFVARSAEAAGVVEIVERLTAG